MPEPPASARLHARVTGLVQGVFFRDSTQQQAGALGVTGWVRNLPDGAVEVLAEGPKPALESLLHYLNRGPSRARVDNIEAEWAEATGEFSAFEVRW